MSRVSKFVKKSSHGSEGFDLNGERKKKPGSRNPLKDLNNINRSRSRSRNTNSSLSIENPRGWLNSVLSNSSSKTPLRGLKILPQTPKSAPNPCPSQCRSKPPTKQRFNGGAISGNLEKPKRTSCLYQWENGKNRSFRTNRLPKPTPDLEGCGSCANELVSGVCLKEEPSKEKQPVDTAEYSSPRLLGAEAEVDLKEVGTPVNKLAPGSGLDSTSDKAIENSTKTNTTPPVQASISPEIQCESSMVSSPTCFGAGHLLSGVTDKRKCRPRGVLTVGDNAVFCKPGAFDGIDHSNDVRHLHASRVSLVPVPTEASVQWLLLPCDEKGEDHWGSSRKGSPESGRLPGFSAIHSHSSSLSRHGFSSDVCSIGNSASTATTTTIYGGGKRRPLVSPIEFPKYGQVVEPMSTVSQKRHSSDHAIGCSSSCTPVPSTTSNLKDALPPGEREYQYDIRRDNSPFSWDSLGSGNVMCTPQSDSSSSMQFGLSSLDGDNHQPHQLELNSMVDILHDTHLSPQSQISMWGVPDVPPLPALSAHFSHQVTTLNSVDSAQIQKPLNDLGVDFSCSSFENVSQSQMRISWKDGLVSHVFEMEESDSCCRLPYEEEEEAAEAVSCCVNNGQTKSDFHHEVSLTAKDDLTLNDCFKPLEFAYDEPAIDGDDRVKIPSERSNVCAESISTEAGGLVASNDSDWSLCFKNQLFQPQDMTCRRKLGGH